MPKRTGILVKGKDIGQGRTSLDFWETERWYNNDHTMKMHRCSNCKDIIIEEPAGTQRLGILPHTVDAGCKFKETTKDLIDWYKKSLKLIGTEIDHFVCSKCGDITSINDYHHKDANLYYSLKERTNCGACARGGE